MSIGTAPARPPLVIVALLAAARLPAQVEEGRCEKYFEFDPDGAVDAALPALKIDDLRKLTLYSKLAVAGGQAAIADDRYMRRIEAHIKDKDVLIVTADHFQFTVLKNGVISAPSLKPEDKKRMSSFIWIKHATRESPNGQPWLKDLVLLPYDKKTGKLVQPWPFQPPKDLAARGTRFSLRAGDPLPARLKLPDERKSVVGTFAAGKQTYLVIDVFGGYSWWGKVGAVEYLAMRGAAPAALDAFHKWSKDKPPKFVQQSWTQPGIHQTGMILAGTQPAAQALLKALPQIMKIPVKSEAAKGWEDLLLPEEGQAALPDIDAQLKDAKTFGEVLGWAGAFLEKKRGASMYQDMASPLPKTLKSSPEGALACLRVARYAFRAAGFPCQILGLDQLPAPYSPIAFLQVYVPSRRKSFILQPGSRTITAIEPDHAGLYRLPAHPSTAQGKYALFDIRMDGGKPDGVPYTF